MHKDLVILVPGILGSVLADADGKEVWAPNAAAIWRLIGSAGGSIEALELRADGSDDGIRATALVSDATLIPGLMKIDGYTHIEQLLCRQLQLVPDEDFRTFPYDWRRDNASNAARFKASALAWLAQWRARSGDQDARVVIIAHSMGGLIARYFVECLGGWEFTRRLITIGTPHRGAPKAAGFLVNGMKKGYGPFGADLSAMLRSCPSVYELLPLYPCVSQGGPQLRVIEAIDRALLPRIDRARAASAASFHAHIADSVRANDSNPRYLASGYTLVPIVGIDQPTAQAIHIQDDRAILLEGLRSADDDGDGTVPRGSATPAELFGKGRELYASEFHGALQNNDPVLVNLRAAITATHIDWTRFMSSTEVAGIRLEVDDMIEPGAPVLVRARPNIANCRLALRVEKLPGGPSAEELLSRDAAAPEWHCAHLTLPAGTWRLTAYGDGLAQVSELVVVAAA
jgi:pimeloyl-ACP methyl ester carboxylesterase